VLSSPGLLLSLMFLESTILLNLSLVKIEMKLDLEYLQGIGVCQEESERFHEGQGPAHEGLCKGLVPAHNNEELREGIGPAQDNEGLHEGLVTAYDDRKN
jgi:hypothetical protein